MSQLFDWPEHFSIFLSYRVMKKIITRMPDILMPLSFPELEFRAFALASICFPMLMASEATNDQKETKRHFDWSWQAVRYRYRSCAECNQEFKALLADSSQLWQSGWGDEELLYQLERRIYLFFASALSVFDSFAFCLYFLGSAIRPSEFLLISKPRKITRKQAAEAFSTVFPQTSISDLLTSLQSDPNLTTNDARFVNIDAVRNVVGHRISGRRVVRGWGTTHLDGTHTQCREETWHLPGATETLMFDEEMLQRHLDDITNLLNPLVSAARQFAELHHPAQVNP